MFHNQSNYTSDNLNNVKNKSLDKKSKDLNRDSKSTKRLRKQSSRSNKVNYHQSSMKTSANAGHNDSINQLVSRFGQDILSNGTDLYYALSVSILNYLDLNERYRHQLCTQLGTDLLMMNADTRMAVLVNTLQIKCTNKNSQKSLDQLNPCPDILKTCSSNQTDMSLIDALQRASLFLNIDIRLISLTYANGLLFHGSSSNEHRPLSLAYHNDQFLAVGFAVERIQLCLHTQMSELLERISLMDGVIRPRLYSSLPMLAATICSMRASLTQSPMILHYNIFLPKTPNDNWYFTDSMASSLQDTLFHHLKINASFYEALITASGDHLYKNASSFSCPNHCSAEHLKLSVKCECLKKLNYYPIDMEPIILAALCNIIQCAIIIIHSSITNAVMSDPRQPLGYSGRSCEGALSLYLPTSPQMTFFKNQVSGAYEFICIAKNECNQHFDEVIITLGSNGWHYLQSQISSMVSRQEAISLIDTGSDKQSRQQLESQDPENVSKDNNQEETTSSNPSTTNIKHRILKTKERILSAFGKIKDNNANNNRLSPCENESVEDVQNQCPQKEPVVQETLDKQIKTSNRSTNNKSSQNKSNIFNNSTKNSQLQQQECIHQYPQDSTSNSDTPISSKNNEVKAFQRRLMHKRKLKLDQSNENADNCLTFQQSPIGIESEMYMRSDQIINPSQDSKQSEVKDISLSIDNQPNLTSAISALTIQKLNERSNSDRMYSNDHQPSSATTTSIGDKWTRSNLKSKNNQKENEFNCSNEVGTNEKITIINVFDGQLNQTATTNGNDNSNDKDLIQQHESTLESNSHKRKLDDVSSLAETTSSNHFIPIERIVLTNKHTDFNDLKSNQTSINSLKNDNLYDSQQQQQDLIKKSLTTKSLTDMEKNEIKNNQSGDNKLNYLAKSSPFRPVAAEINKSERDSSTIRNSTAASRNLTSYQNPTLVLLQNLANLNCDIVDFESLMSQRYQENNIDTTKKKNVDDKMSNLGNFQSQLIKDNSANQSKNISLKNSDCISQENAYVSVSDDNNTIKQYFVEERGSGCLNALAKSIIVTCNNNANAKERIQHRLKLQNGLNEMSPELISHVVKRLKKLCIREWKRNIQRYSAYMYTIDLDQEIQLLADTGMCCSQLENAIPLAVANSLSVEIRIITSFKEYPLLQISPDKPNSNKKGLIVLQLALHQSSQAPFGKYSVVISKDSSSNKKDSSALNNQIITNKTSKSVTFADEPEIRTFERSEAEKAFMLEWQMERDRNRRDRSGTYNYNSNGHLRNDQLMNSEYDRYVYRHAPLMQSMNYNPSNNANQSYVQQPMNIINPTGIMRRDPVMFQPVHAENSNSIDSYYYNMRPNFYGGNGPHFRNSLAPPIFPIGGYIPNAASFLPLLTDNSFSVNSGNHSLK